MRQPFTLRRTLYAILIAWAILVATPAQAAPAAQRGAEEAKGDQQKPPDAPKPNAPAIEVEVNSTTVDPGRIVPIEVKAKNVTDKDTLLRATSARSGDVTVSVQPNSSKDGVSFKPPLLAGSGSQRFSLLDASGAAITQFDLQYRTAEQSRNISEVTGRWWFVALIGIAFLAVIIPFVAAIGTSIYRGDSEFNTNSLPLGLPVGSVRSILAFTLIVYLGFYVLTSVLTGIDFKPPDILLGIVATVIGFYFGSRTEETQDKTSTTAILRGIVTDGSGPARSAVVKFVRAADGVEAFSRITDVNGRFELIGATPAKYKIRAVSTGGNLASVERELVLAGGSDHEIAIVLAPAQGAPPPQAISGVVKTPDGRRAAGATVALSQGGTAVKQATSNADGEYQFPGLEPGDYELKATLDSFGPSDPVSVKVTAGSQQTADLTLKTV